MGLISIFVDSSVALESIDLKWSSLDLLSKIDKTLLQGSNERSANHDLQIEFVFSQITLSSFCETCKSKLSFCWNFCLQGNHKVSVYTQARQIAYILLQKVLNCTLFSCIWIAFWPQTPNGGFKALPHIL